MAESVILSAIERLDSWLLQKPDFFEENYLKLRSLLVDKPDTCRPPFELADFRKDMKEKLYDLLVHKTDFGEENNEKVYNFLVGIADFREDNLDKLYTLMLGMAEFSLDERLALFNLSRHFLLAYKEELYSLLLELADFREANKEKMCSLLVGIADFWEDNDKKKLFSLVVWVAVLPDSGLYKDKRIVNKENVYSLLIEMTELWEYDERDELNKERLHTLLLEITDFRVNKDTGKRYYKKLYMEKAYRLMADICKNIKGKLNKVKMYSWLAKKADLWEHSQLFRLLLDVAFREHKVGDSYPRSMVEGIKGDLRWILDFLRNKKLEKESRLHYFVSDAVEMAHDAQLLIDVRDSDPYIIFLAFNREDLPFITQERSQFADMIHGVQTRIQETKERMLQFGVERGITESENAGDGGEGVVVGLEEDIKLLLGIKNKHTIIIRGMAGSGKTTLARILYSHGAAVADEFDCRAWVSVSWESSRKEMLIKIIRQVVGNKESESDVESLEKMDNECLKQTLHQHLLGMRYFIVLDDVWGKTFLEYVMKALPKDKGSRLLLTTRSMEREQNISSYYYHKMKILDDDESWQLFLKTISFGSSTNEEFPKHLKKRARKMLTECNGLPLAIKEVGRQWAKKTHSEWEELVESIDLSETLEALESSYHRLDPLVKSCFLYLCFYKEGTTIKSKKLKDIWIGGGVVSEKEINSKSIMYELIKSSIIIEEMPEKRTKTWCVNAVFHKLSIKKAEEEMRLEILRNDGNDRLSDNPCHRVFYCSREKLTYSMNQNSNHLVPLFFRGGGCFDNSPSYGKNFEQLKILEMEDFGLKFLPAVGMLIELRYLGLRNNYLQELPRSLVHLKKLEVLDIAQNFTMEVFDIIWEIGSLGRLYMSDIICQKPTKIGAMKNLQTLTYISVDNWVYELSSLEMLHGLRKLGIEEMDRNSDTSKLFASLAKLKNLDRLILRGFRYRSMPSLDKLGVLRNLQHLKLEGRLTRLPSANNFPPNIMFLTLVNSSLDEDPMPVLENLSIRATDTQIAECIYWSANGDLMQWVS